MRKLTYIWLLIFIGSSGVLTAQDLGSIGKESPLSISGGISINQIGYFANGIDNRRDPYAYYVSGNLNFSLYGWSVPLSYTYSNQSGTFNQPFNQYSLHPTYKWITAHLGYVSMNFSPYTLNGHLFQGAGVDVSRDKFKVSAMYGRLRQAVEPDTLNPEKAAYRRMGYGVKGGYYHDGTKVETIIFRSKDDFSSITFQEVDSVTIFPEENLALGVSLSRRFLKKFSVEVDYAASAITTDSRFGSEFNGSFFGNFGGFYTANGTTSTYNAYRIGTAYQGGIFTVGLGYERIDPGYRSHGAYYFNNDYENITFNASTSLFGGKVNVSGNGGVQRDNLDDTKVSEMKRAVGAVSIGYTPSNRLSLNTSYSNFQTFTNIRSQFVDINQLTQFDNLDTLNFTQISQSLSFNSTYQLARSEVKRQSVGLNLTYQGSNDEQGGVEQPTGTNFYMAAGNYSVSFVEQKMNIGVSFNYNLNETPIVNSTTMGPSISFSKSLLDRKLNLNAGTSWNQSRTGGEVQNTVMNIRTGARYVLKQRHNLALNLVAVDRRTPGEDGVTEFREFTATLSYSYSFSENNLFGKNE